MRPNAMQYDMMVNEAAVIILQEIGQDIKDLGENHSGEIANIRILASADMYLNDLVYGVSRKDPSIDNHTWRNQFEADVWSKISHYVIDLPEP